jgi:hypothetical protein
MSTESNQNSTSPLGPPLTSPGSFRGLGLVLVLALVIRLTLLAGNVVDHPWFFFQDLEAVETDISNPVTPYMNSFGFEASNIAHAWVCAGQGYASPYGAAFKGFDRMDVETRPRALETGFAVTLIAIIAILRWPVWTTGAAFSIGTDFAPSVPLLQRLSLALPGAFAMTVMGSFYAAWRRQRRVVWILSGALLGSLVLNVMWISSMGVSAPATVAPLVYTLAAAAIALGIVVIGAGMGKAE